MNRLTTKMTFHTHENPWILLIKFSAASFLSIFLFFYRILRYICDLTTNEKRQRLENEKLNLKYNNETLNTISNDKILGVFVDKNLNWTDNIKHLTKKINASIWLWSKIKKYLSLEHRIQFYKSYIQPHIDFCSIVWRSSSESNKCKIFKLQKRACKVNLDYNVDNSTEAMQSLKIDDRLYLKLHSL